MAFRDQLINSWPAQLNLNEPAQLLINIRMNRLDFALNFKRLHVSLSLELAEFDIKYKKYGHVFIENSIYTIKTTDRQHKIVFVPLNWFTF